MDSTERSRPRSQFFDGVLPSGSKGVPPSRHAILQTSKGPRLREEMRAMNQQRNIDKLGRLEIEMKLFFVSVVVSSCSEARSALDGRMIFYQTEKKCRKR